MHDFHKSPVWRWFLIVSLAFAPALAVLFLQPVPVARGKVGPTPIGTTLSPLEQLAQDLALADARVHAYAVGKRTEVFVIKQVGHQYTAPASACETADCRQVDIYNFDDNLTIAAIVNVDTKEVLDVLQIKGARPGINQRLAQLAITLIRYYPAVEKALGRIPEPQEIVPMDASLVGSSCDLGHVCVAGTLPMHDNILWVVVDLTEEKVVGLSWTRMHPEDIPTIYMQKQAHAPEDCTDAGAVNQDGWTLSYETTGSDGFRIYNVRYNNTLVINNVKLPEWHADYGSNGYVDAVGCSPSGGFPIYPFGNTTTNTLTYSPTNEVVGFEVVRDFRMSSWGQGCNYRYEQHMQFFKDGRFRITGGAYGKGCGNTPSLYRPVIRMDLAVNGDANDSWFNWGGGTWQPQNTETWWSQDKTQSPQGYKWAIADGAGTGYYVAPGSGQFGYNGGDVPPITATNALTDRAFVYLTLHNPAEGDTDLGRIGECCFDNQDQGPDDYVNGEAVTDANLVVWYVPQMLTFSSAPYRCWTVTTTNYYPCFAGPMFVPQAPTAVLSDNGLAVLGEPSSFTATATLLSPLSYTWDFGDGTLANGDWLPSTGPSLSVNHEYAAPGDYSVVLTLTTPAGNVSVQALTHTVDSAFPHPNFAVSAYGVVNNALAFTNTTPGTILTHTWNFGDGALLTSNAAVVNHTYANPGLYTVMLTSTNDLGTATMTKTVQIGYATVASFTGPTQAAANQELSFTNTSVAGTPPITYRWNFGDGTVVTTSATTVAHTYASTGVYSVTLSAISPYGSSSATSSVNVGASALASFSGPTTAQMHELVGFTNTSTGPGNITYQWNFGDGSAISTAVNPYHQWAFAGTYTVTLTATNSNGSHSTTRTITILAPYHNYVTYIVK